MKRVPLEDDHCCFACGMDNPAGLRIAWKTEGTVTNAEWMPSEAFQGGKGFVHRGLLATLLDEAMARLACEVFGHAVTAEMSVRFLGPARLAEALKIRGEVVSDRGRLIDMKAALRDGAGQLIAEATGKIIPKIDF